MDSEDVLIYFVLGSIILVVIQRTKQDHLDIYLSQK